MCDCYKVGGPWVAEDPHCPEHGYAAVKRQEREAEERSELEDRIARLEALVQTQAETIAELKDEIQGMHEAAAGADL